MAFCGGIGGLGAAGFPALFVEKDFEMLQVGSLESTDSTKSTYFRHGTVKNDGIPNSTIDNCEDQKS